MFLKGDNYNIFLKNLLKCETHLESYSDVAWQQTKQNAVARIIITLSTDFPNMWNINMTVLKLIQEVLRQNCHLNKIKLKNLRTNRKRFGNKNSGSL